MKNLIRVSAILGAAIMGISTAGVGVASAATIDNGSNGQTDANVNLEVDENNAQYKLTNAPEFDFGTHTIGAAAMNLQAATVVDNLRVENPGLQSGWVVTARAKNFDDLSGNALNGAYLTLKGESQADDSNNISTAPISDTVQLNSADTPIFHANPGGGLGAWTSVFSPNDTSAVLHIPDGNSEGTYTAAITWEIQDAPSAS